MIILLYCMNYLEYVLQVICILRWKLTEIKYFLTQRKVDLLLVCCKAWQKTKEQLRDQINGECEKED